MVDCGVTNHFPSILTVLIVELLTISLYTNCVDCGVTNHFPSILTVVDCGVTNHFPSILTVVDCGGY